MGDSSLSEAPITKLKGVGTQLQAKLAKLGLETIQDLLFHLPLRYVDRTRITPIGSVVPNTELVVEGEIRGTDVAYGRRRSLVCKIQDGSGVLTLRFYHFSMAQKNNLKPGTRIRCFGDARRGTSGLEMYHPEYQFIEGLAPAPLEHALTPVYPAIEGLTQARLRSIIGQALALIDGQPLTELLPETLPPDKANDDTRLSINEAIRLIHRPPTGTPTDQLTDRSHPAQQRLILEELLAHHLSLLKLRRQNQGREAPPIPADNPSAESALPIPFPLTNAQKRVIKEIHRELSRPYPMLRLLQGDVGSGKTLVAIFAAHRVALAGFQVAVMAPTEILAEQLRDNFQQWLGKAGFSIAFLSGKTKGKGRIAQTSRIASGEAQIIIGTHALFQDDVVFSNLGLVIIDEQHRFGVHQRLSLQSKGRDDLVPHQLIMTATPIPRTLAMTLYADLDCSVIDKLPAGRKPVETVVINNQRRDEVIGRIRQACSTGQQCYWVCTLIEESDELEAQAAEATAGALQLSLPNLNIGLIHGRLKPNDKQAVMDAFKKGDIQLLVATTVIEVGVDVPNATLMVIENPERLGLAQLHQLRGRVGRGTDQSYCVLMYQDPLGQIAKQRLSAMRQTNDGFRIAEIDLKIRGPGEVLGTRQTGEMKLKLADLQRDSYLLPQIQKTASILSAENPELCERLIARWIGGREKYASA
ncbi:MAG: ATP-dependent DNA helicase RecG [bacterium]